MINKVSILVIYDRYFKEYVILLLSKLEEFLWYLVFWYYIEIYYVGFLLWNMVEKIDYNVFMNVVFVFKYIIIFIFILIF